MGNEQSGGVEHWAARPEAARKRRQERRQQEQQQGQQQQQEQEDLRVGGEGSAPSSAAADAAPEQPQPQPQPNGPPNPNMSARALLALKGRKLFSDFQDAQADYAKRWGEQRGVEELFAKEAPELAAKYRIVEPMACGVTAVVCKATSVSSGELVAIKFVRVRVQGLSDAVRRRDCREEARLHRLCDHSNVVRLLDFAIGSTFALYVLEFVPKTLLQKIVERNSKETYSERTAAAYIKDVAQALHQCHSKGVVHMDVKLDNILATADNVAKLCDFGVAEQMKFRNSPIRRTVAAPLFAPPEIYTEGYCDTKADMWSLGVVLYILLCGYPPFKETELQERILQARFTFPMRDWANVSIMARDLISRLLVLDTATRFSAAQVLQHPWIRAVSKTPVQRPLSLPARKSSDVRHAESAAAHAAADAAVQAEAMAQALAPIDLGPAQSAHPRMTSRASGARDGAGSGRDGAALGSSDCGGDGGDGDDFDDGHGELERRLSDPGARESSARPLPLPLRVTQFLRNMHHYRELEKKGFENVPGGQLYRDILDGVDEITVGMTQGQDAAGKNSPSWLERSVSKTLTISSPQESGGTNAAPAAGAKTTNAAAKPHAAPDRKSSDRASGVMPRLVEAFENYYYPDEDDAFYSVEGSGPTSAVTAKDIYAQARFRRRASTSGSSAAPMPAPAPVPAKPTKGAAARKLAQEQAAINRRQHGAVHTHRGRHGLPRKKSFDIRPEAAPDWIADDEVVSCRICDKEFTVFVLHSQPP